MFIGTNPIILDPSGPDCLNCGPMNAVVGIALGVLIGAVIGLLGVLVTIMWDTWRYR